MKHILALALFLFTAGGLCAQQPVLPFVGPDEVRYVYSLSATADDFGGVHGYAVLMHGRAKGTVEAKAVGNTTHYFIVTPEGQKVAYRPSPGERLLWTAEPLPLQVCPSGPKKGWLYVVPPFRGVMVEPPKAAPQVAPPTPQAQPPQVMPTRNYYRTLHRTK